MALERRFATLADDAEFDAFRCCGQPPTVWAEEAENYVRVSALRAAQHALAFRDDAGKLTAVSAFGRDTLVLRGPEPSEEQTWRLQVVAIAVEHQGVGLSARIFDETFAAMREQNPYIDAVTAKVHHDNAASRKACAKVGLDTLEPEGEDYLLLLGRLPVPGS